MLLLITGSADGTADRIVDRYRGEIFRLNHDLLPEYKIRFTEREWSIESPSGFRVCSETVTAAYWWKAFQYWDPSVPKYQAAEVRYFCRDLYGWCAANRKTIGNPPDFHNRWGKMSILGAATKYFSVPKTLTTVSHCGIEELAGSEVVAKSLSSETSEDRKVLHTTQVTPSRLDPKCLWYLQEKLDSLWDVTIFFCNDRCFSFRRSREGLKGLDWRAEQSFDYSEQEWFQFTVDETTQEAVRDLSADLGIEFGRYDFMTTAGNELLFLEVNANGQWVFLDIHDKHGLLDCVADWLRERAD